MVTGADSYRGAVQGADRPWAGHDGQQGIVDPR